jgi:hypothetical protein
MKRYHEEKHIIENRLKTYRRLNASWLEFGVRVSPDTNNPGRDAGRYRKSLRCSGCTRARCQVCHPEKYPKRIPTRQEIQAKKDFQNYDEG